MWNRNCPGAKVDGHGSEGCPLVVAPNFCRPPLYKLVDCLCVVGMQPRGKGFEISWGSCQLRNMEAGALLLFERPAIQCMEGWSKSSSRIGVLCLPFDRNLGVLGGLLVKCKGTRQEWRLQSVRHHEIGQL